MSRNQREGYFIGKHFGKRIRVPRPTSYEVNSYFHKSPRGAVGRYYAPYFYLG